MQIVTKKGEIILLDKDDWLKYHQFNWWVGKNGYACGHMGDWKRHFYLHRVIKNTPKGKVTDHINHNKLDNRKSNLRIVGQSENMLNRGVLNKNNTSGFTGVSFIEFFGRNKVPRWTAVIKINRKVKYLGSYITKAEAIKARLQYERMYL